MADRTCPRCGKAFDYPSKLKRHLAAKKPCTALVPPLSFSCKKCARGFTTPQALSRHTNHRCKAPPAEECAVGGLAEVSLLRAELAAIKDQLGQAVAVPHHADYSRHTDNSVRADTLNVQMNVHLPPPSEVRNFGEEDTSHLKKLLGRMLDTLPKGTQGEAVVAGVIRSIWNDPEHPQNMTIHIPNKRDNVPHVKTPFGWQPRSEAEVYPRIIDRACTELQDNQDHELGFTPSGLKHLHERSEHVAAAFQAEERLREQPNFKQMATLVRPSLRHGPPVDALPSGAEKRTLAGTK